MENTSPHQVDCTNMSSPGLWELTGMACKNHKWSMEVPNVSPVQRGLHLEVCLLLDLSLFPALSEQANGVCHAMRNKARSLTLRARRGDKFQKFNRTGLFLSEDSQTGA